MKTRKRGGARGHGATMHEVGLAAGGYHHATVSKALRNDPSIGRTTRTLIQRVARKMGYRRDPLLDALIRHRLERTGRRAQTVVALIGEQATRQELEALARHCALWRGAAAAAQRLGHQLEYFPFGVGRMTARRLDAVLYARGIRGVIVGPLGPGAAPPALMWDRYSAVKIECGHLATPSCTVAPALLRGMGEAFERLQQMGVRRIGLVLGAGIDGLRLAQLRAGFLLAQQREPACTPVPPLEIDDPGAALPIRVWMRRYCPEVVVASPEIWRTIVTALRRTRIREPQWACLDSADAPDDATGLVIDYEMLGATAAEQVIGLMRTFQRATEREAVTTYVAVSWRDRCQARKEG